MKTPASAILMAICVILLLACGQKDPPEGAAGKSPELPAADAGPAERKNAVSPTPEISPDVTPLAGEKPEALAAQPEPWAPEEDKAHDPMPVESPTSTAQSGAAVTQAPSEVVPFAAGVDPFGKLAPPVVPELSSDDPRADVLRLGPEVPPEAGEKFLPFPPREKVVKAEKPITPPLKVVRHSPDKNVDMVAAVTASFSLPMVPLASLPELDRASSPLKISPAVPGRFVWMGTSTVAFEPQEQRMPLARQFTAQIAAGTKSATGAELGEAYSWSFETPRPRVVSASPGDGQEGVDVDSTLRLTFNARVDPAKMAGYVSLKSESGELIPLTVVLPAPIEKPAENLVDKGEQQVRHSRTVEFRPDTPLPVATRFTIIVAKELTCAEGPLPAGKEQQFKFVTYYPLKVEKISCHWDDEDCYPGAAVEIQFNNPLPPRKVDELVDIQPPPAGLRLKVSGRQVAAYGTFMPSTSYAVTVKPGFEDVHGQRSEEGKIRTVHYRRARPFLRLMKEGLVVLEALQGHEYLLTSMNLSDATLKMANISTARLPEFVRKARSWQSFEEEYLADADCTVDRKLKLAEGDNQVVQSRLDLDEVLGDSQRGFVFIDVKSKRSRGFFKGFDKFRRRALVQVTDLGITAAMSHDKMVIYVTRLSDAAPVARASLTLFELNSGRTLLTHSTNKKGVSQIEGPRQLEAAGPYLLVATLDGDSAFLVLEGSGFGGYLSSYRYANRSPVASEQPRSLVFSERGLYRPAEEVNISLVVRKRTVGPEGDVMALPSEQRVVSWAVLDPRHNELAKGQLTLSAFGTGAFTVKTKKNAPLGNYSVRFSGPAGSGSGGFRVEEYRTPEYEVAAKWKVGDENILLGRKLNATISGKYFFGGSMSGAQVEWRLFRNKGHYSPPGNPGFVFADVDPFEPASPWDYGDRYHDSRQWVQGDTSTLDASGNLGLALDLKPGSVKRGPMVFTLEAEVFDQNRQAIAARATVLAHRAERYVGVALDRTVVGAGHSVDVSSVVTRVSGDRYETAKVDLVLVKTSWDEHEIVADNGDVSYDRRYRETPVGECSTKVGRLPGKCSLKVPSAGRYLVRATTLDKAGRKARSAVHLYAYGEGQAFQAPAKNSVELVPDKSEYEAGEVARVLIQSPFEKATGMVMISREGIVKTEVVHITNGSLAYELPIEERWMPSIALSVALVRGRTEEPGATPDDKGRPSFAHGSHSLSISRASRAISVGLEPSKEALDPGEEFTLDLTATDSDGRAVQANIALMVVDEGVLSLIAYSTPDPLKAIFRSVAAETAMADLRPLVVPRMKPKVEMEAEPDDDDFGDAKLAQAPAGGAFELEEEGAPESTREEKKAPRKARRGKKDKAGPGFAVRKLFKSTAYFNGQLQTDDSGKLSVTIKLPDNLTRFRIMAVAADQGVKVGSADSQVRTRLPLIVRPALPRFLNFGDTFRAAAVVNNETGMDTEVMVRCMAANATIEGQTVKTVKAPAGKAVEVQFDAKAGTPGPATFQFAAVALTAAKQTDAASVTIPTLIPATSEAFATYGVVEEAVVQPISPPADALPGFGGLQVAMSSTALTGLQDAVKYLFDYPYECTEQLCSRLLPIIALKDILADFNLGKAGTSEEAARMVKEGLNKLYTHQRADGGFGYWPGSDRSWLYVSAYAAMTIQLAQAAGYDVPDYRLQKVASFLEERLGHPYKWEAWAYGSQTMAVLVLARLGRAAPDHMDRLYGLAVTEPGKGEDEDYNPLTLYARAWLLEAYGLVDKDGGQFAELYRQINNAAVETASAIHFAEDKRESLRLMMHSEDRTDAIVLGALLAVKADDPMVEKVVRGLVRSRVKGRWATTQANAYALLGLAGYYALFEKAAPDFQARLWHGDRYLTGRTFKGRQMDIFKTSIPMEALFKQAGEDLLLAKKGSGRLYYRLGLSYAPANLKLAAEERGFSVQRVYLPEGDDGQLKRNENGDWEAKAGTYVRVKLQVTAPDRRYYVAVVDPLPAGLEAVNESFATTAKNRLGGDEAVSHRTRDRWYWHWNPWDFSEKRDDRVQLFMDRMYGGVYEYTYLARATTIGDFVVPPARAEEMYEPETFGRNATVRFKVTP